MYNLYSKSTTSLTNPKNFSELSPPITMMQYFLRVCYYLLLNVGLRSCCFNVSHSKSKSRMIENQPHSVLYFTQTICFAISIHIGWMIGQSGWYQYSAWCLYWNNWTVPCWKSSIDLFQTIIKKDRRIFQQNTFDKDYCFEYSPLAQL